MNETMLSGYSLVIGNRITSLSAFDEAGVKLNSHRDMAYGVPGVTRFDAGKAC